MGQCTNERIIYLIVSTSFDQIWGKSNKIYINYFNFQYPERDNNFHCWYFLVHIKMYNANINLLMGYFSDELNSTCYGLREAAIDIWILERVYQEYFFCHSCPQLSQDFCNNILKPNVLGYKKMTVHKWML